MKLTSDVDCDISEHPYSMLTYITKANIVNNDLQGLRVFRQQVVALCIHLRHC